MCFVAPGWWGPLSGGRVVTKIMLRRGRGESQGGFGPPGGAVPVGMLRGTESNEKIKLGNSLLKTKDFFRRQRNKNEYINN